jgi:hypothetical protein
VRPGGPGGRPRHQRPATARLGRLPATDARLTTHHSNRPAAHRAARNATPGARLLAWAVLHHDVLAGPGGICQGRW